MSSSHPAENPKHEAEAFLLRTAELLHRYGTPSYRLEGVMSKVAESLNVPSVFLYTPTALVVSLGSGADERTFLRRVDSGDIDISKVLAFDAVLENLEAGKISLSQAAECLETEANAAAPFGLPVSLLAAAIACGGISVIFGGNVIDTIVAGVFGCFITWATVLFPRVEQRGWREPVLGFSAAIFAVGIAHWLPVNDRLITLAALILPIPGLPLTIAFTELATGHLSSGSARLAGAAVTLFTLVLGVAVAWRLSADFVQPIPPMAALPDWCLWIAVAVTPLAFAVVFRVPLTEWWAVVSVVVSGFVASRIAGEVAGIEVGAFTGALVVGCISNIYARLLDRPAMVLQTPGLLILVPGSIGYKSLTAMLESDTVRGVELAVSMMFVGVALAGGLLLANQVISPKRIL